MNFLNEIASRYPGAISSASGRPCEQFFDVALIHRYVDAFCDYLTGELGYSEPQVNRALFQYGQTKGIIDELIVRYRQGGCVDCLGAAGSLRAPRRFRPTACI